MHLLPIRREGGNTGLDAPSEFNHCPRLIRDLDEGLPIIIRFEWKRIYQSCLSLSLASERSSASLNLFFGNRHGALDGSGIGAMTVGRACIRLYGPSVLPTLQTEVYWCGRNTFFVSVHSPPAQDTRRPGDPPIDRGSPQKLTLAFAMQLSG